MYLILMNCSLLNMIHFDDIYFSIRFLFSSGNVKFRPAYEFGDRREHVVSARTYFYEDERMCDENLQHFLQGIDAVTG